MPPLDLLDSVTSGHLTTPRSSRPAAAANNSLDGPPPPLPPRPQPQTMDSSPPLLASSPPAYRPPSTPRARRTRTRARALVRVLRLIYLDVAVMLLALAVTYLVMQLSPLVFLSSSRRFLMTWEPVSARWYGPPELSYPRRPLILNSLVTGVVVPVVGVGVVVGMQVWVRRWGDVGAGVGGIFKGLVMMTLIQICLKQWIGEFRPHFITVCNPVLSPPIMTEPFPFRRYVTPEVCQPDHRLPENAELWAMQSFPSGHTSESFFMGTFLALYLNAKLKAFSDYHTSFWKWLAVMLPLLGACLVAGTLVVDRNHHVHDILLSIPWGVLVAFLAYRCHYASVLDSRTNHLPLPWSGTRRSLRPTVPASVTERGDNLAAVTWPRTPVEHSFDRKRERSAQLGLDGVVDRRRGPRNVVRGRLRQNLFPQPRPLMGDRTGAVVPDGRGEFELRDVVDVDPGPETARATGHEVDLEGQRQRRRTLGSGEEVG